MDEELKDLSASLENPPPGEPGHSEDRGAFKFCQYCGRELVKVQRWTSLKRVYCRHTGRKLNDSRIYLSCPVLTKWWGFFLRRSKKSGFHDMLSREGVERGQSVAARVPTSSY